MRECPFCHTALQGEAVFCPACMREFGERTRVEPKKAPGHTFQTAAKVTIAILTAAIVTILLLLFLPRKKTSDFRLPAFSEFQQIASVAVAEKNAELWEPKSLSPSGPSDIPGTDRLSSKSLLWAKGEVRGLSSDANLAYSAEDGEAALCFSSLLDAEYETALSVTETFLSGLFSEYTADLASALSLDDPRWQEERSEETTVFLRRFRPDRGDACEILFIRSSKSPDGTFSFGVFVLPEVS